MSDVKAVVRFDSVGWHPYLDDANERKARLTMYADKGETISLPKAEFDRLAAIVDPVTGIPAVTAPGASVPSPPEVMVTTPGGTPTDEPTDTPATPPVEGEFGRTILEKMEAREQAEGVPVTDEGTPAETGEPATLEERLSDLTVPELLDLAERSNVEVSSKERKADLVAKLAAANVSPTSPEG